MCPCILKNWQNLCTITRELLFCLILAGVTLLQYWSIQFAEFITFDDQLHIVNNSYLKSGFSWASLLWAFSTDYGGNWHPITWLSFMADYYLFGLNPSGYHIVNLLIHIMNSALLFFVLHRMTNAFWRSGFVAVLFAVHPMHVESVAWVSERKDLLCALFGFMAMGAYDQYTKRLNIKYYFLLIAFFCLGLMSKPMILTLPFMLLLFDYWPLRRIQFDDHPTIRESLKTLRSLVIEKIPLFILSLLSAVMTYHAQQAWNAISSMEMLPLNIRVLNAVSSYALYIEKAFWPVSLSVFYPLIVSHDAIEIILYGILLVMITIFAIGKSRSHPYLIVGWLIYLGVLVPVIGIIKIGSQSMADRYTYIPFVGLFIMASWGIPDLIKRLVHRKFYMVGAVFVVLLFFSVNTWHQAHYWRDSVTLFTRALQITSRNYAAHENLGFA
jgi:protein O-mannosyl-transferase